MSGKQNVYFGTGIKMTIKKTEALKKTEIYEKTLFDHDFVKVKKAKMFHPCSADLVTKTILMEYNICCFFIKSFKCLDSLRICF